MSWAASDCDSTRRTLSPQVLPIDGAPPPLNQVNLTRVTFQIPAPSTPDGGTCSFPGAASGFQEHCSTVAPNRRRQQRCKSVTAVGANWEQ